VLPNPQRFSEDTTVRCPEYSLAKFVGTHSTDGKSYKDMNDLMQERFDLGAHSCPHLVSIRSRSLFKRYSKLVKLSEVITQVRAHDPTINKFYVCACRTHHTSYLTLLRAMVIGP
jgi:hypothetical protein